MVLHMLQIFGWKKKKEKERSKRRRELQEEKALHEENSVNIWEIVVFFVSLHPNITDYE